MTRLRRMMLEELERRNYTQNTRRIYLHALGDFARYFHCTPDQLGLDHIRDHQAHLFRVRKLKPNSVGVHVAGHSFRRNSTLSESNGYAWCGEDYLNSSNGPRSPEVLHDGRGQKATFRRYRRRLRDTNRRE